ncbi:MAG: hypothetical protein LBE48_03745 [Methanomassiliicoccaceae archaeon]|jgi:hypothetical protein|nr:hypothetical protein [Methanomassiliicoccaceae archaeon]
MQGRTKILFVSIVAAIFIIAAAFVLLMVTDPSIIEDEDRMFTLVSAFVAVFVILNLILLFIGWRETRTAKDVTAKNCVSCGTKIDQNAKVCTKCRAMQPLILNESVYLDPKVQNDRTIRPKK